MRYLLTFAVSLFAISGFAQKSTVTADLVRAKIELNLSGHAVTAVEVDTALSSQSDANIPTSKATRDFVLNHLQRIDTLYTIEDTLYLVAGQDTFTAVLPSGGVAGDVVVSFTISGDTLYLETDQALFEVDLSPYAAPGVDTFYRASDTLRLVVGEDTIDVLLPPFPPTDSVVSLSISGDTLYLETDQALFEVDLSPYSIFGVDTFYKAGDTLRLQLVGGQTFDIVLSGVTGSGTNNQVAKWTGSQTLGDSQITDTGTRVGIATSPTSARLHVRGITSVANPIAIFEAFSGAKAVELAEDSRVIFGNESQRPYIAALNGGSTSLNGRELGLYSAVLSTTTNKDFIQFWNQFQSTFSSGSVNHLRVWGDFSPSSGQGVYSALRVSPIVNQTGSATGVTNGIIVSPTLTSAVNWRSFTSTNTVGLAFYDSGGAKSRFTGRVQIGDDTDPDRVLEVTGDFRVTQSVDTLTPKYVWASNEQGDFKKYIVGEGLQFSGDSLIAVAVPSTPPGYAWCVVNTPYLDTVNASASSIIRFDNGQALLDYALTAGHEIEYQGGDTLIVNVDARVTIKSSVATTVQLVVVAEFGELAASAMNVNIGSNVLHLGSHALLSVPQIDIYGTDTISVYIKNTDSVTRYYTVEDASVIVTKVSEWTPPGGGS